MSLPPLNIDEFKHPSHVMTAACRASHKKFDDVLRVSFRVDHIDGTYTQGTFENTTRRPKDTSQSRGGNPNLIEWLLILALAMVAVIGGVMTYRGTL